MSSMDSSQIAEYLEPSCKEMFDAYLLVGYTAGDHKLTFVGDLGHPLKIPELNRNLRPLYRQAQKMMKDEYEKGETDGQEEDKKGLAGL